jgi:hypothetical protein
MGNRDYSFVEAPLAEEKLKGQSTKYKLPDEQLTTDIPSSIIASMKFRY